MQKPVIISGPEALAEVVKLQRKQLRATQEVLAGMHGVSRFTIVDAESGKGDPKLSTILTLLNGLGLSLMAVPTHLARQIELTGVQGQHDVSAPDGSGAPGEDIDDWDFDLETDP